MLPFVSTLPFSLRKDCMVQDFRLGFLFMLDKSCCLSHQCKCSYTSQSQLELTLNTQVQDQTLLQWYSTQRGRIGLQPRQGGATETRAAICLPVNIIVERVVASKGNQGTKTQTIGEENLCGSIQPNLIAGNNFFKNLFLHLRSRSQV